MTFRNAKATIVAAVFDGYNMERNAVKEAIKAQESGIVILKAFDKNVRCNRTSRGF